MSKSDSGRDSAIERLKVTSPRLEQDEFVLTPSGRPDRPDARRLDPSAYSTSSRARGEWDGPKAAVETEGTTLDTFEEGDDAE